MDKAIHSLCLGVFVLLLSLVLWRATSSLLGWVVVFIPGAVFVFRGWYEIFVG